MIAVYWRSKRLIVSPLACVKANRPTVAEVFASDTVQELFVTVGTV